MVSEDGTSPYTASVAANASATLSGVTMDAAGITGTKDVYNAAIIGDIDAAEINASNLLVQGNAELQYLILKDFEAAGNVTLSDVTLTSSSSTATTLTDVTIGSGVKVDASGSYILSGNLTFEYVCSCIYILAIRAIVLLCRRIIRTLCVLICLSRVLYHPF